MDQCQTNNDGERSGSQHGFADVGQGGGDTMLPVEVCDDQGRFEHEKHDEVAALESAITEEGSTPQVSAEHLTHRQIMNLLFCVLAWACTIANVTLGM